MKKSFGTVDLEIKNHQIWMTFNRPNYTYQRYTVEEAEELWQGLMEICHEMRRQEQIAKVNN